MDEKKEYRGEFWLESDPDRRVPGHLTYHPKRAGTLLLHDSLRRGMPLSRGGQYERIMGKVLGRSCVLLNCFDSGASQSEARRGEWEVNPRIFVNALLLVPREHADAPADTFVAASGRFDGLHEFDGRMPFKFDRPKDANDEDAWIEQITAFRLEPRAVNAENIRVEFFQGPGSLSGEYRKQTLLSLHTMRVTPRQENLSLDQVVDYYTQARDLVAVAMHQDCRFDGPLHLQPAPREGESEEGRRASYEYYARWRRGTRHSYPLHNRILSFESLTADGIARWLALKEECGHVISRLVSMRYTRRLAYEDALLRVVAAADSLHRVVFPRKEWTKSRTMLRELGEFAGYPFRDAVPNLEDWAHTVITERDNAAHNKGLAVSEPALATPLIESVYFLVLVGLLRRAEVPDTAFTGLRGSQPFVWPMKRVFERFGGDNWLKTMGKTRGGVGG